MRTLFPLTKKWAKFSDCAKFRFALSRIWDESLPFVMFIGLNPSTADATKDDPTIKRVCKIARHNGFGGIYMVNCFAFITAYPEQLQFGKQDYNNSWITSLSCDCDEIVFAWGSFDVVKEHGRDKELQRMFPNAKALHINKDGSPKHPLYCKEESLLIPFAP